ncbi:MAG: N-acetyltransferase [Chloroflexi bacterium]|nr:N-acetyltransferase [Chloroflexota bacterium]
MNIRPEIPADYAEIRSLLLASFPTADEADLVEQLRTDGDVEISLVAIEGDQVIGHVVFSVMSAPFRALGLAPVAVLADHRRKGVAERLINTGIEQAKNDGWEGMFVLGEPDYYQRFGFRAETAQGFESVYAGPYLMALSLKSEVLPKTSGRIDYAPAFAGL